MVASIGGPRRLDPPYNRLNFVVRYTLFWAVPCPNHRIPSTIWLHRRQRWAMGLLMRCSKRPSESADTCGDIEVAYKIRQDLIAASSFGGQLT